jgi:hypothetical protein
VNAKTLAEKLNGRQYRKEMTEQEQEEAKENGLVVVFGSSDDLTEFRGAIYDEVDSFDGATIKLDHYGLIKPICDNDDCPHEVKKLSEAKNKIMANWCELDGYSWSYRTTIPHESFDIFEDKDKYCRGIIFSIKDLVLSHQQRG